MASNINPSNIDTTYPIAGQDNDTQGFRDNYTNIKQNFAVAASEITALQANTGALATSITTLQEFMLSSSTPTSNSSVGTAGQIAFDSTHLYVCVAANTWVRTSLTTF